MKRILLLSSFLLLWCRSIADTTWRATGWHQENEITYLKVQFDFGWAAFQLRGDHVGDVGTMISKGCMLKKRWGLFFFQPIPNLSYVNRKDEQRIKDALQLKTLCR